MPQCGHLTQIECCKRRNARQNPTYCRATCDVFLKCGHQCKARCGTCVEHTQRQVPGFNLTPLNRDLMNHLPCETPCKKTLLCGHECAEICHEGNQFSYMKTSFVFQGRTVGSAQGLVQLSVVIDHVVATRSVRSLVFLAR